MFAQVLRAYKCVKYGRSIRYRGEVITFPKKGALPTSTPNNSEVYYPNQFKFCSFIRGTNAYISAKHGRSSHRK